ncbi:hypothetical protein [Nocardioides pakistanensis]
MAKHASSDGDPNRHPDGHVLLDGARWHYPKQGEPTVCAVEGCPRVLGQQTAPEVEDETSEATADEIAAAA